MELLHQVKAIAAVIKQAQAQVVMVWVAVAQVPPAETLQLAQLQAVLEQPLIHLGHLPQAQAIAVTTQVVAVQALQEQVFQELQMVVPVEMVYPLQLLVLQ